MQRLVSVFLSGLLLLGLCGAGQQAPQRAIEFSPADRAELDRVSAYLNTIRTLKGEFVQINPDGDVGQGEFYLEKPGRMRFEYRPPVPTLVVSNGRWVAVKNSRLNTVDRYPASETPLAFILGDNIDLRRNPLIVGVAHQDGMFVVEARTSTNHTHPDINIVFSEPELELRQWTVRDAQGLLTTVALRNLEQGVALDDSLFTLPTKDSAKP